MRFHFGPYVGRVLPEAGLPYAIPLCRHVDDLPVPDGAYPISVGLSDTPAALQGMRAQMVGWSADLAEDGTAVHLHPHDPPDYRFFNEMFAALGIGRAILDGGFVLHASSFEAEGKAFLFAGLSGAGKSTIARHLGAGHRISDDQSMVLPWGASWWCRCAFHLEHEGAPPAGIFLISQSRATRVVRLAPERALAEVLRHLVLWQGDGRAHARILDNVSRFLESVPAYHLDVGLEDIRLSHLFEALP